MSLNDTLVTDGQSQKMCNTIAEWDNRVVDAAQHFHPSMSEIPGPVHAHILT